MSRARRREARATAAQRRARVNAAVRGDRVRAAVRGGDGFGARDARARQVITDADASLLDVVDNVLNKGVVITGDVVLSLASVDLVYLRLSAVLCAADRLLGGRT